MDNNNWRPAPAGGGGGGGEPTMDAGDWRSQLQPDSRQRIVNKIMDTLKRHLPFSGQEGLQELKKIAVRFEEKIYTSATSQPDYLRKISLKMLTMETKSQNTMANSLPSNSGSSSKNPPDTGSLGNQGQSLPNPMVGNQAHARQQLLSQNIQNNMAATTVQGSANLASALPTIGGLPPTTVPNVVGQNSNLQNIQNVSGISQNSVGNSMGQGVSPNIFANTQRQMPGRQQVVPQQQQSQNPQQQYVYQQQQLQQQLMKPKYQQGSIPNTQIQSHLQQQQAQHQQNQMLSQSSQLQPSQQSVMQHSVMQPAPISGLQQNQQSSVQQSTQTMLQQNSQAVLRQQQQQQQQQPSIIHQQQTPMQQQPSMLPSQQQQPSMLPSQQQQQQQQQLMGQQPNSTILQQNQIVGQQNSIPDMQQQQQRLLSQQNSLTNLHQQQQQLMGQLNNIPNMHQQQQQLGAQSNMGALQQRQQQQLLVNQSGNSSMQTTQHSVHMLQQSKIPLQQQNHQSVPTLLPTQGQQSEPQPSQQQLLSQLQSQPGQLQQQGLQQPNPLQRDMQQRLQTSGPLLQSQNIIDQQKQLLQSQRPIPEASSTSLDSTAQTGNANSADWQEEIYQKIKVMKEAYLPELNELFQKIAGKLQQHDSLPQQPKNEQFEKLKIFKTMLERILQFLQVPKSSILPNFKEKLGAYEKQIVNFLNSSRPRKPGPPLHQGQQIPPPHIQSMQQSQQSQSQFTLVHPMQENQMNPQLQSMNLQGSSVATLQQNNVATLQHNSFSLSGVPNTSQSMISTLQPGSTIDSGQGSTLNALQQVAVGSLQQNPVNAQQQANINSLSSHSGMNVIQPNLTPLQSNFNMLQHQHLKQQEQQMLQTQLKQQFQQRHMQQQMMQKLQLLQQQQQNQMLSQSSQLQTSQQSVMQHSVMQPAPVTGLQQNQQASVQQSPQTMLQQNSQAVLQQQQPAGPNSKHPGSLYFSCSKKNGRCEFCRWCLPISQNVEVSRTDGTHVAVLQTKVQMLVEHAQVMRTINRGLVWCLLAAIVVIFVIMIN